MSAARRLLTLCLAAAALQVSALAQAAPAAGVTPSIADLAAVAPVMDCAQLVKADVSTAVGAKTVITAAVAVPDAKPAAYCKVTGYVEPAVKFEVRLPLSTWTQRYVQTGCGGLCGSVGIRLGNAGGCDPANHGEFALATTDMGHSGGMDGQFGDDPQLRTDFAYRGVHVTTLAAKALIAAYYGRPAKYSYFAGCSDGGREALMEAQRFPNDFDGITAGAPAMNFTTQNTFYHGWNVLQNTGADGKPILTADKLPILHQAALDACDAADGLKDGLISDPLHCHFDPAAVECKPGQSEEHCLTHSQVEVARAIYAGPHDAKGKKLAISGPLPGSELAWRAYVPASANRPPMGRSIATGTLKYLAYEKNPGADFKLSDLQFTRESFAATTRLHGLYDATDPDLRPYASHGGKLILWHGFADGDISPINTIAYYTAMQSLLGEAPVAAFARLYLLPGVHHCGGGDGPSQIDLMSAIMAWVEVGRAPQALKVAHQKGGQSGPMAGVPGPPPGGPMGPPPGGAMPPMMGGEGGPGATSAPAVIDRTRLVFPYPLSASFTGNGSSDDAANFVAGQARPAAPAQLQWLGADFYRAGYELWCGQQSAGYRCEPRPAAH